jgi:hypothetical protein
MFTKDTANTIRETRTQNNMGEEEYCDIRKPAKTETTRDEINKISNRTAKL